VRCGKRENIGSGGSIPYPSCESPIYLELLWVEVVRRTILLLPNVGESISEPYGYLCGVQSPHRATLKFKVLNITLCKILRGDMLET
jgi:hypothetical protein